MHCIACGTALPPGMATCPECGTPTPYNTADSLSDAASVEVASASLLTSPPLKEASTSSSDAPPVEVTQPTPEVGATEQPSSRANRWQARKATAHTPSAQRRWSLSRGMLVLLT